MKRLLLISNSTQHGRGYLDHVEGERETFSAPPAGSCSCRTMFDRGSYTGKTGTRIEAMGYELTALESAEAIFVGGGNTFRLLKALQDLAHGGSRGGRFTERRLRDLHSVSRADPAPWSPAARNLPLRRRLG
jgi:hypothetical protein